VKMKITAGARHSGIRFIGPAAVN